MPKWLTRLFTTSKHTDPVVAAAEQPTLDAVHATLSNATSAIDPAINDAVEAADAIADTLLTKLGVAGTLLSPAAHAGVSLAANAIKAAIDAKLGLQPGDTVPAAAA